jgi:hypothetical protein
MKIEGGITHLKNKRIFLLLKLRTLMSNHLCRTNAEKITNRLRDPKRIMLALKSREDLMAIMTI